MQYNRRNFIRVTSLASASLLPVIKTLSAALNTDEGEMSAALDGDFNNELEFHLLDKNLLNLHFYFVNATKKNGKLYPKDNKPSFMIARLPQQHISEKGYFAKDRKDPQANMSGYSFLAFQLFPPNEHQAAYIPFNIEELLDWNNERHFKLITLIEWLKLAGSEHSPAELIFLDKAEMSGKDVSTFVPIGVMEGYEPQSAIYKEYRTRVIKLLLSRPLPKYFIPITLFEVPEKLLLVPFFRSELIKDAHKSGIKRRIRFYSNDLLSRKKKKNLDKV